MHEVLMPDLGGGVERVTVGRWRKEVGERVSAGEVLLEVIADKVTLEVEAPSSGVLRKIVAPEGAQVPPEQVLGYIGEPDEPVPEGPAVPPAGPSRPATAEEPPAMRRIIAERMTRSKSTIPHYYLVAEVDVTELVALRREVFRRHGVRPSFNDFILAACARALREVPQVGARWTEGGIEPLGRIDIGLAVALEEGLVVPVLRDVDALTVPELAQRSRALIEKARTKRLTPGDCAGAAMTVTSLGTFGIDFFIPIIPPGQSAILAVGQAVDRPVVHLGKVAVRRTVKLTLSCDHRVIDGAVGARFLDEVRTLLEHPDRLPLE